MGYFVEQAEKLERRAGEIRAALPATANVFPSIGQTAQLVTDMCRLMASMAALLESRQGGDNAPS